MHSCTCIFEYILDHVKYVFFTIAILLKLGTTPAETPLLRASLFEGVLDGESIGCGTQDQLLASRLGWRTHPSPLEV